jgi:hypothetical protein
MTSKRFNNSFPKQLGVKKNFELTLTIVERGRMILDYEVLFDQPSQCTISCHSSKATVLQISKELLTKIQHINEEYYEGWKKTALAT